jgi:hypothetical protein
MRALYKESRDVDYDDTHDTAKERRPLYKVNGPEVRQPGLEQVWGRLRLGEGGGGVGMRGEG